MFEAVYYVTTPGYNAYMDIQQTVNLEIHRQFAGEDIEFAYPTQTLYIHPASAAGTEGRPAPAARDRPLTTS